MGFWFGSQYPRIIRGLQIRGVFANRQLLSIPVYLTVAVKTGSSGLLQDDDTHTATT